MSYEVTYLELNAIGIALTLIVLCGSYRERDHQASNAVFRLFSWATLVCLFLDAAWILIEGRAGEAHLIANNVINSCYLFFMELPPYLWLLFVLCKLNRGVAPKRWIKITTALPLAVMLVLCVASPWTHWLFEISELNVYTRGELIAVHQIIGFAYVLCAGVMAMARFFRETDKERKSEALTLCSFAVLPMTGAFLNAFVTGLPTTWPLTAVSLVMVYMNLQAQQISTDSLTGLNNRRQFDKYIAAQLADRHRTGTLALLLIDIDDFKSVNDTFGHSVGDSALMQVAAMLRQVCNERNVFLARYGGDEFAVVLSTTEKLEADAIIHDLNEAFSRFNKCSGQKYELHFSAGVGRQTEYADTPIKLIEIADRDLYETKSAKRC